MTSGIACGSKFFLLASGMELHYHEAGDGRPLILLHGGGPGASGFSNYQNNYGYFAERGYRVLMPDIIGWGKSSKPTGVSHDYELLAGSLYAWLEALDIDRCSIAGNSMGGALAINLAIDHPGLVEKLILLAPAALADPAAVGVTPGMQALFTIATGGRPISIESMTNLFSLMYHNPADVDPRMVVERTKVANTQAEDLYANLALTTHKDRLGEIQCPTLMLWGASDKFCPLETGFGLLEQCPTSRMLVLAACGHWVQAEQAELFNRMTIDFLQNG